jgi:hypothetical protein
LPAKSLHDHHFIAKIHDGSKRKLPQDWTAYSDVWIVTSTAARSLILRRIPLQPAGRLSLFVSGGDLSNELRGLGRAATTDERLRIGPSAAFSQAMHARGSNSLNDCPTVHLSDLPRENPSIYESLRTTADAHHECITQPPSTLIVWPVTSDALELLKKTIIAAMCSGVCHLPRGTTRLILSAAQSS